MEEASPAIDGEELLKNFETVFSSGVAWNIDVIAEMTGQRFTAEQFEPLTAHVYETGRQRKAGDYLGAVAFLQHLSRVMADFLSGHDLWLTPTLAEPPVRLGTFDLSSYGSSEEMARRVWSFIPFTPLCNATGLPAMSVPQYWNKAGLPVGTQFIAPFGDEATLFRLASQLEAAHPWAARKPPIFA